MNIPRSEHPKPQFQRDNWINLNGEWAFEIDNGCSGIARGLAQAETLSGKITVPFCPQSKLSGVEHTDFIRGVWYKRRITLTEAQCNECIRIHFGAVDYHCTVFVNGQKVGTHHGGYVSFAFDIAAFVHPGENIITVYAEDDERDSMIPRGKQSDRYYSYGCSYTRTTGIWQTVWLEFLPHTHIEKVKFYPDVDTGAVRITAELCGAAELSVSATYQGKEVGSVSKSVNGGYTELTIQFSEVHLWEVGCGRLYDLTLRYGEDTVKSYVGLRSIQLDGLRFRLNGKSVFQRTILDQGFYPDGIYTAPNDLELQRDIARSMACGFNGARLHEKVFEERFLYHCDRMGYIVWGEYPNWGLDHTNPNAIYSILPEWTAEIERDFNHPSIIGWCPFNETWDINGHQQYNELLRLVYRTTKAIDCTRPCIDTSGNYHVETDIFDIHNYTQDPEAMAFYLAPLETEHAFAVSPDKHLSSIDKRQKYDGKSPVFVSEYGGIGWSTAENGWGYGNSPKTSEEFIARFRGLTEAIMNNPCVMGLCYTQLTNVEQEQNGLYTYDRQPKFDPEIFREILSQQAAIEKE